MHVKVKLEQVNIFFVYLFHKNGNIKCKKTTKIWYRNDFLFKNITFAYICVNTFNCL